MSIIKVSKNNIRPRNGSVKYGRGNISYNSSMVSGWETSNKSSMEALNKYYDRIRNKEYLSAQDMAEYRSAMDNYISTAERLRSLRRILGGTDAEDSTQWAETIEAMRSGYDEAAKYYSKWDTEDKYNAYLKKAQDDQKMMSFDLGAGKEEIGRIEAEIASLSDSMSFWDRLGAAADNIGLRGFADQEDVDKSNKIAQLEDLLAEKKRYYTQAELMQRSKIMASVGDPTASNYDPDFDKYVQAGKEAGRNIPRYTRGDGSADIMHWLSDVGGDYIIANRENPHLVNLSQSNLDAYASEDLQYARRMTEDEYNTYAYYYGKYGQEKAREYLEALKQDINARMADDLVDTVGDTTALKMVFGTVAGLDQFGSGLESFFSNDDYIVPTSTQMASAEIRESLSDSGPQLPDWMGGASVGQVGYDMVTTTANMLPSILMSNIPVVGPALGAVSLGASAAGNAYAEMVNLGYDKGQARAYSLLVGASESALQYALGGISKLGGKLSGNAIAKFVSKFDNALARTAIKLGGNMLSEGLEESIQSVLEPIFKSIATGEDFEGIAWDEVLYSGILGSLSAGILESAGTVAGEVNTYRQGKAIKEVGTENVARLVSLGQTFSADSVAYQLAGKVNEKTGAYTIGRLFNEIGATLSEQNKTDIARALVDKGMTERDAATISKWLGKAVDGGYFNKRQIAALESNDVIADVFRDVIIDQNSTVNQRIQGYNESLHALANEMSRGKAAVAPQVVQANEQSDVAPQSLEDPTAMLSDQEVIRRIAEATGVDIVPAQQGFARQAEASSVTENAPVEQNAAEGKFEATETGKTMLGNTEVSVKEIASVKDGAVTLRLDDGSTVSARDLDFGTEAEAALYESVADMKLNAATANAFVRGFNPNDGLSAEEYALGFREAYRYGEYSFPVAEMSRNGFSAKLTQAQKSLAYDLGKADMKYKIAEKQSLPQKIANTEAINAEKTALTGKRGKVYYEKGVSTKGLTNRQKASLKGVERLADALGVDFYIYESEVGENGKRQGANGWFDPKDGSIHLDLYAGLHGNGTILFTAAHEMTHLIRAWSPEKFQGFADFIMEKYGEKGVSVDALVKGRIAAAKKNGRDIDFDTAYEEVIANSCESLLADGDVIEKIAELKAKDKTLWEKIKSYITDLVAKIKAVYKGMSPDSVEGRFASEILDVAEKLKAMWTEALVEASEASSIVKIDAATESVSPLLSERTWTESEYVTEREKTAKKISKELGVSLASAYKYIDDINSVARLIADDRVRLDYEPNLDEKATVLKPNSDYKYTVDMSTLCAKRLLFTGTFDAIQRALPNTVLDSEDIVALRKMMQDRGYEVACGICYVESTRREIGRITQDFIDSYVESQKTGKPMTRVNSNGKEIELTKTKDQKKTTVDKSTDKFYAEKGYTPTLADLNTTDIDFVKRDHPLVYEAYLNFMNARGQAKPKLLETRAEYKGEILKHFTAKTVKSRNAAGGLRLQSFSDFEVPHLIDMMQIVMDMARVGLKSQAYTKVPAFAEVFGDTGVKINLSLIARGDGVDADGNLVFDDVEGIDHKKAFALREQFTKNVGTVLVGKTDAHIIAAMADPRIDYIIPFHKSSWKESLYDALGLTGYSDYTESQNEKPIDKNREISNFDPSEYWDFSKSGDENAQVYLAKCREDGRIPKFPQFQGYPGYWKLLIDFKMYDNDGVGSPQEVVRPEFNTEASERILSEYKGGHKSFPVAKDVVEDFVRERKDGVKYSDRYQAAEENLDILSMVEKVENGGFKANEKLSLGKVSDLAAAEIHKITGIDVKGFDVAIEARQIEHILKDHGKNGKTDKSMASHTDIAKMEFALEDYDSISAAGKTQAYTHMVNGRNRTADTVLYEKSIGEKAYYVVQAVPDTKAKTLFIVTAFIGKKGYKKEASQLINAKRPDVTAKTGSADTSVNIISHSDESVKRKFSDRDSSYMDAVNRGDMETAQKMVDEAAKAAGYTPVKKYHQTGRKFTRFSNENPDAWLNDSDTPNGYFFKDNDHDIGVGADFVKTGHGGSIQMEVYLKDSNLLYFENRDAAQKWYSKHVPGYAEILQKYNNHIEEYKRIDQENTAKMFEELNALVEKGEDTSENELAVMDKYDKIIDGWIAEKEEYETSLRAQMRKLLNTYFIESDSGYNGIELADDGHRYIDGKREDVHTYIVFNNTQIKSSDPVTYDDNGNIIPLSERFKAENNDIRYSDRVTDEETLDFLNEQIERGEYDPETNPNGGYYVTYKSMSFWGYDENGNAILRSPMAEYVDGQLSNAYLVPKDKSNLNWYKATEVIDEETGFPTGLLVGVKQEGKKNKVYLRASENQDLIEEDWSNLYFNLKKKVFKNGKWENSDVPARYNPYEHSSNSMLNDQFKAAYLRDNLVTVKMYVPVSEDNGTYRAKWSKDPTGWAEWKSGDVAGKINKQKNLQRKVYLSRYAAPVEIVPDSEVAKAYKGYLEGTDVAIPDNVVPPNLLKELEKIGVPIERSGKVKYSDRDPDSVSNRSLLANALESVAKNDIERSKLAEYKSKIALIDAEQEKLAKTRAEIKKLSFATGKRDTAAIKRLQDEATKITNRINTYDRQLMNLEATKALKGVLEREKQKAYKKAEQRGKEALAAYRAKAIADQRALMTRYQESRAKGVEGRRKTEMRHKIKGVVGDLNQYLLKGTKDKHVPIGLQKAVAEALEAVNMDTVSAAERIAKLEAELAAAKTPDAMQEITRKIDRIREMGERMDSKLLSLKNAYDDIVNDTDPMIAGSHDEVISESIAKVIKEVGSTPLRDMSLSQLESVYDMYRMVLTTVQNVNKAFKAAKKEEISVIANRVIAEVAGRGKKKELQSKAGQFASKFDWNNLKPVYAFSRIGSDTFTELFDQVRAGEDTWAVDITEAKEFSMAQRKKFKYDAWDFKERFTFTSTSGLDFELSLDQIMSLYAFSKREQAKEHLQRGGIVFDESTKITAKNKLGIPTEYNPTQATAYNLSDDVLASIIGKLTPDQKAFVDAMQGYLSDTMGEKGNEVSLALYGIKLFKEKHYFPLKSATQFMTKAKEQQKGEVKIKNSGFSKETTPKASNPIVLTPFMDVWADHVNEMSMYHAFVLALEDFYRVFNYKTPTSDVMAIESVEMYLQNAHGKAATQYIEQLLKDLNGGARVDPTAGIINKMTGLFKKSAVFASASVVIQQPSSIARATALVDARYFVGMPAKGKHRDVWAEVKKYAPVAIIKEMGYFDTGMGQSTVDWIKGDKTWRDKVDAVASKAPALADEYAWCAIWNAVKRETLNAYNHLAPNSDAFLKVVGERFTEVIVKTQVYDSVLSRSANMRSKDTGMKMATAFMGEPTTSINMLEDALIQGKRGNKAYARKAIGSVLASMMINSVLVSLVYAGRDDDEDKTYAEKYAATLTEELLDSINPLTLIPFVKDIVSIVQGYDVERSDMAVVTDLVDAWNSLGSEKRSAYRKVEDFAGAIASIFGLPVKNVMRDARAIYNTVNSFINGEKTTTTGVKNAVSEAVTNDSKSNDQQLYEATVEGDAAHVERIKRRYKDQSAIDAALRSALREYDPRIRAAAQAVVEGKPSERVLIQKEIIAEKHFGQDVVVAATNAEIAYLRGKITEARKAKRAGDDEDLEKIAEALIQRGYPEDFVESVLN